MPTTIQILAHETPIEAELDDSPCARAIAEKLPIEAVANVWANEIYFRVGLKGKADETARDHFEFGEIGYAPAFDSVCLFLGPTPMSQSPEEAIAADKVNPIGHIVGDFGPLKKIDIGDEVELRLKE